MQSWTGTKRHGVTRKKKKDEKHIKKLFRENSRIKDVYINLSLYLIQIQGERKSFCRQNIPECSCTSKETIGIDILITTRNGCRKIVNY